MAWCPVCKCEYKEGIEICADCKVKLVSSLKDIEEEKEEEISLFDETNEEDNKAVGEDENSAEKNKKNSGLYRESTELSKENKASAYILLFIGILGIIALILVFFDVLPFYSGMVSKISSAVVLGTLFVVFIIMGIVSLKNAKKLDQKAVEEGDLTTEIRTYFMNSFTGNSLDEILSENPEWNTFSEEMKYFGRMDFIKDKITEKFLNLEEGYVDFICDKIYEELFENTDV